jgi:hypothetical protein
MSLPSRRAVFLRVFFQIDRFYLLPLAFFTSGKTSICVVRPGYSSGSGVGDVGVVEAFGSGEGVVEGTGVWNVT